MTSLILISMDGGKSPLQFCFLNGLAMFSKENTVNVEYNGTVEHVSKNATAKNNPKMRCQAMSGKIPQEIVAGEHILVNDKCKWLL